MGCVSQPLQEPAELFFQEIAKTLPQECKPLDPFCIRLSQTLKIGLLRNQFCVWGSSRIKRGLLRGVVVREDSAA